MKNEELQVSPATRRLLQFFILNSLIKNDTRCVVSQGVVSRITSRGARGYEPSYR